jgi:hypothetical protein
VHLLNANVLITAHNTYYPIDQVPQFWSWLKKKGLEGEVKIPAEIFEEIKDGSTDDEVDALYAWVTDLENKAALVLDEEPDPTLVQHVTENGYGQGLTDDEIEEIGRDPFLIAYALVDRARRWVVTTEVSRPSAKRQNRKVPDVCKDLGVHCCDTFVMTKKLGFKTS